jgi:hypothetical protein
MTDRTLSPTAQAIEDAYFNADGFGYRNALAAVLKQLVSSEETTYCGDDWVETPHCIPSYVIENIIKELEQNEKNSCV